jgi:hypothetical protein
MSFEEKDLLIHAFTRYASYGALLRQVCYLLAMDATKM